MIISNLSIIIPVYNEQERISVSLDTILEYSASSDFHCEILIGDDGSNDNTADIVNEYVGSGILLKDPVRFMIFSYLTVPSERS